MTVKGILLDKQGNVKGAEEFLREALRSLDKKDSAQAAAANFAMGDLLRGTTHTKRPYPIWKRPSRMITSQAFTKGLPMT